MIAIGNDHTACTFKKEIIKHLIDRGFEIKDLGANDCTETDYPDFARIVCKSIQTGECDKGLLFCGTGIGMCITANKVRGIRAANCNESFGAELSRRHNNANVLCLGARMIGVELAKKIIDVWLETPFDGGRHQTRVDRISLIENAEGRD